TPLPQSSACPQCASSRLGSSNVLVCTRTGVTVETEPMPMPTLVWVTVAGVQHSPTRWTYTLTGGKSGSLNDGTRDDRPHPTANVCYSYPELCDCLCPYGVTPPPPEYFAPPFQELDEGAEPILRPVMMRLR